MKKFLSLLLTLCLVFTALPMSVFSVAAADETTSQNADTGDWSYEFYGEGVCLTAYNGSAEDLTVPGKITVDGTEYQVLKLGDGLFQNNTTLNSATFGDGILEIGTAAFKNCTDLVCVILNEELTTVGAEAFYGCNSFNSVIIYDAVTQIGENAFANCTSLTVWCNENSYGYNYAIANNIPYEILNPLSKPETVILDGVTYFIENGEAAAINCDKTVTEVAVPEKVNDCPVTKMKATFKNCTKLQKVTLPESITEIGKELFSGCSKLTDVNIPSKVTKIGNNAFDGCYSLEKIKIPNSTTHIGSSAFFGCNSLTEIKIPNSVTSIGEDAFFICTSLTEVKISNSVTSIGRGTFACCDSLIEIEIPNSVTSIGSNAFDGCTNLEKVTIPESVTSIDSKAFYNCANLQKVIIPKSVKYLSITSFHASTIFMVYENSYAHQFATQNDLLYFVYDGTNEPQIVTTGGVTYVLADGEATAINCDKTVTEVTVPEKINDCPVTKMIATFKDCKKLQKATLPESITEISDYLFYSCSKLTDVNIPSKVTKIGDSAFQWCNSLAKIEIPNGVTGIGENAFEFCISLTEIRIPNSVTSIGEYAFSNCSSLTKIELTNGITSIGNSAFSYCKSLTNINIPNSVTKIYNAFDGCTSLTKIEIPNGVTTIASRAFSDCTNLQKVIIPESVKYLYTTSFPENTILMVYEDSYAHKFATDNDLLYFIYDGTNEPQIVTTDGVTYILSDGEATAINCDKTVTEVTVPEKVNDCPVTKMKATFKNCTKLQKVTLPESITEIGKELFSGCSKLTDVNIPSKVTKIGNYAFWCCDSLTEIEIPNGVTSIGGMAFSYCRSLTKIKIPSSVTNIGGNAFSNCNSFTEIELPSNVIKISDGMLFGCEKLTKIEIPNSVTYIGISAFSSCKSLTEIKIPSSVTRISSYAFQNCTNLQKVIIPESVTTLSTTSFPTNTILMVYEDSYAHKFAVDNDLLYFVLRRTANPEIAYGASISGKAVYDDGTAASGAEVQIAYSDGVVKGTVTADQNGEYKFTYAEVGGYTVTATDKDGNIASCNVGVKRLNVFDVFVSGDTSLTLKKSYSVSGVAEKGETDVILTDKEGNVLDETVSGKDKTFKISGLQNGEYIVKSETDNGTAVCEVTVFNADVTGIELKVPESSTGTAEIKGFVEVDDREHHHHRRNWVEIKLYNEQGNVVSACHSEKDGSYAFGNLPLGEYTVVAKTYEMRPDCHHGYERSYQLTGYAYVNVTKSETYNADIVLYEENNCFATVCGRVIAKGSLRKCTVTLTDVFRNEIASTELKNDGSYCFKNVRDGMYFVTAVTQKDGMGYCVITVENGKVYGGTDIYVCKSDNIKHHEDCFYNDVPTCKNKNEAEKYRKRIAAEKNFYDGLSHKEKLELSADYIERLNKLCEWLSDCEYKTSDGVKAEGGGLVMTGDRIENKDDVTFSIEVKTKDKPTVNTDGVKNGEDYLYHCVNDAAIGNVQQYYEITMTETSGNETKEITDIRKDLTATGKIRITMPIPEDCKGHKNYSIVHIHCGEVTVLTDLDDDPDTITFEVDKFSTFVLTETDDTLSETSVNDGLKFSGASLTLQNDISVNYKVDSSIAEQFDNLYVKFTFGGKEYTVNKYKTDEDGKLVFVFDHIAPNRMNDTIYATLYGTKDGVLYNSRETEYSICDYCYNMLGKCTDEKYANLRALLVDLLNFGTESQNYTDYNTDSLANAKLTDGQKAYGTTENRELNSVQNLAYKKIENPTVNWKGGGLYLAQSVEMRFTIEAENIENLTVKAVCGDEEWIIGSDEFVSIGNNRYYVYFGGLNAAQMSENVEFTVYNGDTAVSNTLLYSIESYAAAKANGTDQNLSDLVMAMIKYGDSAKKYAGI